MTTNFLKTANGITFKALSTAPASPVNGMVYYDSVSNTLKIYQNGVWVDTSVLGGIVVDSTFSINDSSDPTKKIKFDAAGSTSTTTTIASSQTANRTMTIPDATDTFVGKATSDVLTNKDIDGGVASNNNRLTVPKAAKAVLDPLTRKSGTLVYATDNNTLYADNGSNLIAVGAGSGAGEVTLVANGSDAYAGWASVGNPINAPTTTTSAADLPLAGYIDTAVKIYSNNTTGSETADYSYYTIVTPASLATKLKVEFWVRSQFTMISGEWTVSVYQSTTRQALSTDDPTTGFTSLPAASGKFTTYFDCQPSTTYQVRFTRRLNAGLQFGFLYLARLIVGPGIQPQGAVVGPWQSYTPTFTSIATSSTSGRWRQVGDSMEVQVYGVASANATGIITAPLPTSPSVTIDTTKLASGGNDQIVGVVYLNESGGNLWEGVASYSTATSVRFTSNNAGNYWNATNPIAGGFQSGDKISTYFTVPIAEWAGSGTINQAQNDVEYAWNSDVSNTDSTTGTFAYGSAGAPFGSYTATRIKRVRFQTPIQATDKIELEVFWNSAWVPVGTTNLGILDATHGMMFEDTAINGTDIDIIFGSAGYLVAPASIAGTWASVAVAPTLYKWRLKKIAGGQAVGFGAATSTLSGLVSREVQWTTFAPALAKASGAGTLGASTINHARYAQIGKTVFVQVYYSNITVTVGVISLQITLPLLPARKMYPTSWVGNAGTNAIARHDIDVGVAQMGINGGISGNTFAVGSSDFMLDFFYEAL